MYPLFFNRGYIVFYIIFNSNVISNIEINISVFYIVVFIGSSKKVW